MNWCGKPPPERTAIRRQALPLGADPQAIGLRDRRRAAIENAVRCGELPREGLHVMAPMRWLGRRRRQLACRTAALVVVLVSLTAVARACVLRPGRVLPGASYNGGKNAAWLGVEWVSGPHREAEIALLADDLERWQIGTVYVYASYLRADGEFNPTYAYAAQFVRELKAASPALSVQAWVGIPLRSRFPLSRGRGLAELDESGRARIAAFCAFLVRDSGFDGVHLDPEPAPTGDRRLIMLLDAVRTAIGPGRTLSVAAPRLWPIPPQTGLSLGWQAAYYRQVAAHVDQLAVMVYDSAMPLPWLYRLWVRLQVVGLTRALDGSGVELFIGVPTSEEETWTHRPWAENMHSGLLGVIDGLNDRDARPGVVTGVAIYPYWETDPTEWGAYETLWLGR